MGLDSELNCLISLLSKHQKLNVFGSNAGFTLDTNKSNNTENLVEDLVKLFRNALKDKPIDTPSFYLKDDSGEKINFPKIYETASQIIEDNEISYFNISPIPLDEIGFDPAAEYANKCIQDFIFFANHKKFFELNGLNEHSTIKELVNLVDNDNAVSKPEIKRIVFSFRNQIFQSLEIKHNLFEIIKKKNLSNVFINEKHVQRNFVFTKLLVKTGNVLVVDYINTLITSKNINQRNYENLLKVLDYLFYNITILNKEFTPPPFKIN